MLAALIAEVVMTAFFLIIILGATGRRSSELCTNRNWLGVDFDSLDLNSRNLHISQSSAFNSRGDFLGWLGHSGALAVLGCADCWRHCGRFDPQVFAQKRGITQTIKRAARPEPPPLIILD